MVYVSRHPEPEPGCFNQCLEDTRNIGCYELFHVFVLQQCRCNDSVDLCTVRHGCAYNCVQVNLHTYQYSMLLSVKETSGSSQLCADECKDQVCWLGQCLLGLLILAALEIAMRTGEA